MKNAQAVYKFDSLMKKCLGERRFQKATDVVFQGKYSRHSHENHGERWLSAWGELALTCHEVLQEK